MAVSVSLNTSYFNFYSYLISRSVFLYQFIQINFDTRNFIRESSAIKELNNNSSSSILVSFIPDSFSFRIGTKESHKALKETYITIHKMSKLKLLTEGVFP